MEHMEYYIMKLYESKKKTGEIQLGINRFSPSKKIAAIILLFLLLSSVLTMGVLLFLFPNNFWFLCGLIPCVILMATLLIIDAIDRRENIEAHVQEYTKRINILHKMLVDDFLIDDKHKLEEVTSMFQKYVNKQTKQEKKMQKVIIAIFSSFIGVITTVLSNLESIGIDFTDWLNVVIVLLTLLCMVCTLIYMGYYVVKNIYSKKEKYQSLINDLQYIQLCKYQ